MRKNSKISLRDFNEKIIEVLKKEVFIKENLVKQKLKKENFITGFI